MKMILFLLMISVSVGVRAMDLEGGAMREWYDALSDDGLDVYEHGVTELHRCASDGYIEKIHCLAFLYHDTIDLSIRDNGGCTPLHWAAAFGQLLAVTCLVKHFGVKPDPVDSDGRVPGDLALMYGHYDICEYLGNACRGAGG